MRDTKTQTFSRASERPIRDGSNAADAPIEKHIFTKKNRKKTHIQVNQADKDSVHKKNTCNIPQQKLLHAITITASQPKENLIYVSCKMLTKYKLHACRFLLVVFTLFVARFRFFLSFYSDLLGRNKWKIENKKSKEKERKYLTKNRISQKVFDFSLRSLYFPIFNEVPFSGVNIFLFPFMSFDIAVVDVVAVAWSWFLLDLHLLPLFAHSQSDNEIAKHGESTN